MTHIDNCKVVFMKYISASREWENCSQEKNMEINKRTSKKLINIPNKNLKNIKNKLLKINF